MNDMQYFAQLQDVMIRSGQLVMQYFHGNYDVFEKEHSSLVTTVDFENEKFLKSELVKIMPEAGFLAEESGVSGAESDYIWVIDALDGTRNFAKGIPHFCIMIALTYKNEPIVAAIYQPMTQELYYAEKGKGLWLNGITRIEFADRQIDSKGVIVICSDVDFQIMKLKLKENKIQISRRYFGSAGIDAIYLAAGNVDCIIFRNIAWWDVAAGMLLIEEAGSLIFHYEKSIENSVYGTLKAGNKLFFHDC
jgi:myo-inositol-1(or 4)-monophosphatase